MRGTSPVLVADPNRSTRLKGLGLRSTIRYVLCHDTISILDEGSLLLGLRSTSRYALSHDTGIERRPLLDAWGRVWAWAYRSGRYNKYVATVV